jgi:hypothetical protein
MFENDKPTAQSNLAHNIYVNANREINRLRKKLTIKNIEIKRRDRAPTDDAKRHVGA